MKKRLEGAKALAMALLITVVSTHGFAQMPKPGLRYVPHVDRRGLIENLRAAGHFTKLLALLDKAGLTNTLSDSNKSFTLFAPDDDAFALLPAVWLADLMADPAKARGFILPYILNGKFTSKDLIPPVPRDKLLTLAGSSLQTSSRVPIKTGGSFSLIVIFDPARNKNEGNGWPCCAGIVSADHLASNGIYHAVTFVTASGGAWR